jgi:hypothetical protein
MTSTADGMTSTAAAMATAAATTTTVLSEGAAAQNEGGESAAQQGGEFRHWDSTFHNVTNSIFGRSADQHSMNQPSTAAAEIGGRSSPF